MLARRTPQQRGPLRPSRRTSASAREEVSRCAEPRANAGQALTGRQAKLYSQRLRRDTGQEGLATFVEGDVSVALDEAMLLLECGLLEREVDPTMGWRASVKRAAELLGFVDKA